MLRLFLLFVFPFILFASEVETICQIDHENLPEITEMIDAELKVGLLLVQFADWESNDDARGSVGWDRSNPDLAEMVIDKYHYQDYWNIFFSSGTYEDPGAENGVGGLHPDWQSHQRVVWGSFKDYWWEASNKNLTIVAPVTRQPENLTGDPMKDNGIINNINSDGSIEWVTLDQTKNYFTQIPDIAEAAEEKAHQLFLNQQLDTDVKNATLYDVIVVQFAGTNHLNYATIYRSVDSGIGYTVNSERRAEGGNTAFLNGFGADAHECGHLLGFDDLYQGGPDHKYGVGIYSIMSYGVSYATGRFLPSHPDPLNKLKVGWLDYDIIDASITDYVLNPVSDVDQTGNAKVAILNINDQPISQTGSWPGKYFILENRTAIGFDRRLTIDDQGFNGGMIVWRRDSYQEFSNGFNLMVMEADVSAENPLGDGEISQNVSTGDISDFFPGTTNNTILSDETLPYLKNRDDEPSHWAINDISYNGYSIAISGITPYNGVELINSNETWSANKTLNSDVTVLSGGKLTISPGTTVNIDNSEKVKILIKSGAEIEILGTQESPVIFQASNQGSDNNWWDGLEIENGAIFNISNVIIKNASTGLNYSYATLGTVTFNNVKIYDCLNAFSLHNATMVTFNDSYFDCENLSLPGQFSFNNSTFKVSSEIVHSNTSSILFSGCTFINSTLEFGGGSAPLITKNTFLSSGIKIRESLNPSIKNNLFIGNNSGEAVRLGYERDEEWINRSSAIIENNTFTNYEFAIAIYDNSDDSDGEPTIRNNIFYQNQKTEEGYKQLTLPSSTVEYNCFYNNDNTGAIPIQNVGNFIDDPLFIDPANSDFHLLESSPCIDTGDPSYDQSNEPQPSVNINIGCYGNTTEASINTNWSNDKNISRNVSVPSTVTLTILEDVELTFDYGCSITVEGGIEVLGTESSPVTFSCNGSSVSWDGIELMDAGYGLFHYCNFHNSVAAIKVQSGAYNYVENSLFLDCSYGIWFNNYALGDVSSSNFNNCLRGIYTSYSSPSIISCNFENCSEGIRLFHSYNPQDWNNELITGNSFYSNTSIPMFLIDSSPFISNNTFDNNYRGLWIWAYSEPILEENTITNSNLWGIYCGSGSNADIYTNNYYNKGGYNIVTNTQNNGIYITGESYPLLGAEVGGYGNNSIYNNSGYEIASYCSSIIEANYNWWGESFSRPGSGPNIYGYVDWYPFLSSDPIQASRASSSVTIENNGYFPEALEKAYQEQMQGNYESAALLFKDYFLSYPKDDYATRACTEYAKSCDGYLKAEEIIKEFESTLAQLKNTDLLFTLNNALVIIMPRAVSPKETMAKIDEICKAELTIDQQNQMDVQRAFLYIYDMDDLAKGQACLENIVSKSATGDDANEIATYELNSMKISSNEEKLAKQNLSEELVETLLEFKLYGNYPNPFNPSTNIKFSLAEASQVTIEIFNVLGQKVRTFNRTSLDKGLHQVTWDGRNELGSEVTSGLYIMRFTAQSGNQNFYKVNRMLLIR